ncbi:hypothetical protein PAECIP111893_00253 [Paenibacillus plantiphilus]|uniref:Uncharacterized protein n=1 Tax=Paenibacillus plantiphilus TaxID=2905650 RepID=A0ABM9BP21_9BACL|nr:CD1375 family protein [Paenibacillus plantiphilus]CAH1190273.1 hypothetical protein PAECIP111893_00253 [Paenibacillus plantiphilus]
MAAIYFRLIQLGIKTIDDVPDRDRAAVQALIDNNQEGSA